MIADTAWYVPSMDIRRDLQIPTVKKKSTAKALASAHIQMT
jgi:hypothetical protein